MSARERLASWTEVKPESSICLAVVRRKPSRSSSVQGGMTAVTRAMALSTKMPEGSPEGRRTMRPPGTVVGRSEPSLAMMEGDTQRACTSTVGERESGWFSKLDDEGSLTSLEVDGSSGESGITLKVILRREKSLWVPLKI